MLLVPERQRELGHNSQNENPERQSWKQNFTLKMIVKRNKY